MEAISLFQQSKLDAAIQAQTALLRSKPGDLDARYNMAALLAFAGEFDRALVHLDFLSAENPALAAAAAMYVSSLHAEEERRRAYDLGHVPGTDPTNEAAVKRRVRLRQALVQGDAAAAAAVMAEIAAEPVPAASLDGGPAAPLCDQDEGIGALLEVFVGGRCLWVPTANLRSVEFTPPRGLFDLLYAQCAIETTGGVKYAAHVPVLYAGSHAHPDPAVRCGHRTEWQDVLGIAFRGHGQRVFRVGDREPSLLELRRVTFPAAS
ncbi:MAG: hypothetical protein JNL08_09740 [Planctomycetes bacterium]|nr:hypothetical protein [Planctomycetota bacterium]